MTFVFLAMLLSLIGLVAAIIAYYFKILAIDEAKKELAFFQNEAVKRGHATWNMSTREPGKSEFQWKDPPKNVEEAKVESWRSKVQRERFLRDRIATRGTREERGILQEYWKEPAVA